MYNPYVRAVRNLAFAGALLAPWNAHAYGYGACRYEKVLTSQSDTAVLEVSGARASYSEGSSGNLASFASLGDQLVNNLRFSLDQQVRSELSSAPEYTGSSVQVYGPVQFAFSGNPGSNTANASMSLGSLGISASFQKKKYIFGIVRVSASCNISINLSNPTFAGSYDVLNNRLSLSATQLNISHTQNCSTSLGWLPGIGTLIDGFINDRVGARIDAIVGSSISRYLSQSYTPANFAGLQQSIPDGRLVAYGVDYGRYIRQGLFDLFTHNQVIIRFAERNTPGLAYSVNEELFSLSLPNQGLRLSVNENRTYDYVWRGGYGCYEP